MMELFAEKPVSGAPRRRRMKLRSLETSIVVHTVAFLWFARVWLWHLTPAASVLPGAQGWGWFVRFLTFYSFTFQTATLGLAAADDWSKALTGSSRFSRVADDLSCAVFALAHVVTLMFYAIQAATNKVVEGDTERPPWLNASVHLYNSLAVWADLLTSHRSFSASSERLSSVLTATYICYLQLCRQMNGQYPYPFLRNMPEPYGFIGTAGSGLIIFAGAFRVGKAMNRGVRALSLSIDGRGDTITIRATKSSSGGGAARALHSGAYAVVRRMRRSVPGAKLE
ncbi:MAG: FAR-17a/AIG1-like protein-domain-containing protein [Monoraphidium minutum]|nr:MAG: FAR-17a/AIG1-like protein-domain-containing protein [Monoraphidium minutum]